MSRLTQIQALIRYGLYYLTEHAYDEAIDDDLTIHDIEFGMLNGRIRRTWPRSGKFEIVGTALDGRPIGIVCRITRGNKARIITAYEDRY